MKLYHENCIKVQHYNLHKIYERNIHMSYLEDHYDEIFKKYSTEELLEDIRNYQLGGGQAD